MGQISATIKIVSLPAVLGAAMVTMDADPAEAVPLPTCNDPVNCLIFEDFTVYSLELLNAISGTKDFDQTSTPGYLGQNAITIGSGSNGLKNDVDQDNKTIEDIDNPYGTPNNVSVKFGEFANFEMITHDLKVPSDPDPDFPAQGDNTVTATVPIYGAGGVDTGKDTTGDIWDATTADIRSIFDPGEAVVFYFNLNESNKGGDDVLNNGQDMYGWLQVTLTDLNGNLLPQVFTLSGALGFSGGDQGGSSSQTTDPAANGFDGILPEADDLWAHVHGEICVDASNQADPFVHFGECVGGDPAGAATVNQNLGADQAAFALFNQQLSDLILNPNSGYELVSVDLRMGHLDNGFEQLFILPTQIGITQVPEPSTIAMFMAGLLGLAPLAWRRLAV